MRPVVTDTKTIYIRFRTDVDDLITLEAQRAGTPKARLVSKVLTEYIRHIEVSCNGAFGSLNKSALKLSSLSSSFFVKKGRSNDGRALGKPMRVTIKKVDDKNMQLAAFAAGYSITQFRTAVMVTWACNEGLL